MLPCKLNRNHPKIENKINPVKKKPKDANFHREKQILD
jgi:hypothetical protein